MKWLKKIMPKLWKEKSKKKQEKNLLTESDELSKKLQEHKRLQEKELKKENRLYKRYNQYCPSPEKNKTELPEYWNDLNSFEKHRWMEENMLEKEEKKYMGVENGRRI
jgi:uncharacterized FlgJ-related protein